MLRLISRALYSATIAMSLFIAPCAWALPIPFFKMPFVPDFYQHQKAGDGANVPGENLTFAGAPPLGPAPQPATVPDYATAPNWWENGFGWCCISAHVNSFYFLEKAYSIKGLFTRAGGENRTWQEQMIFATEDMAKDVFPQLGDPLPGPDRIPKHLRKLEAAAMFPAGGPDKLTYTEFTNLHPVTGAVTSNVFERDADRLGNLGPPMDVTARFGSLFDVYRRELCRSEDVVVRIAYTGLGPPVGTTAPWWAPSFHAMTGAGVEDCSDPMKRIIYVADPDKRNMENAAINGYEDTDVRTRYPYDPDPSDNTAVPPIPQGPLHYERLVLGPNGCIISEDPAKTVLYQNACLFMVTAISPAPEPAMLWIFSLGTVVMAWLRRRALALHGQ